METKEKNSKEEGSEKKVVDKKEKNQNPTPEPIPVPEPTPEADKPISLASFLNMHTLPRHLRWKQERLHRAKATAMHTVTEWTDITGLGKEENVK